MKLNLGCPDYCEGYVCVDLLPRDKRVVKSDAVTYLKNNVGLFDEVKAYNLIEHLPNVGDFFKYAHKALIANGLLEIRTDNAWFPLFHFNLIHRWGWGAHVSPDYYPPIMNGTKHFSLYTKLHLRNYAETYGFEVVFLRYATCFARLLAMYRKILFDA
jgi:hypothetical protein